MVHLTGLTSEISSGEFRNQEI